MVVTLHGGADPAIARREQITLGLGFGHTGPGVLASVLAFLVGAGIVIDIIAVIAAIDIIAVILVILVAAVAFAIDGEKGRPATGGAALGKGGVAEGDKHLRKGAGGSAPAEGSCAPATPPDNPPPPDHTAPLHDTAPLPAVLEKIVGSGEAG